MKGVSVVVCCYNSATRLTETIRHLSQQCLEKDSSVEIVIVNNASTDDTIMVARRECENIKNSRIDFLVLDQPIPGKSYALEKGVEIAKYENIIICDDDNWLEKNYISNAIKIVNSDEKIGAAGGLGIAVCEIQLPEWWEDVKIGYAIGPQGCQTGDISNRKFLWGAGMVTKKSLFLQAFSTKFPPLLTCRKGGNLTSGGDAEYSMRLILLGYKLFYDESLIFRHYIPKERLTVSYRDRLLVGIANSQIVLIEYINQINYLLLTRNKRLKYFLKSLAILFICTFSTTKRWSKQKQIDNIYRVMRISIGKVNKDVITISEFVSFHQKLRNQRQKDIKKV